MYISICIHLYTCTCIVLVNTHTTIKQSFLITASNGGTIHRNSKTILNNFKKNSVLVGELIIIGPSLTFTWTMYMYVHIH